MSRRNGCGCNSNNNYLSYQPCPTDPVAPTGCINIVPDTCVEYTGTDLSCLDITTGTRLDVILENLDEIICSISPFTLTWGSGVTLCVTNPDSTSPDNLQDFIEAICTNLCALRTSYTAFTGTYAVDLAALIARLVALEKPVITGSLVFPVTGGVTTMNTILQTTVNTITDLYSKLDLSCVTTWSSTFPTTTPTTLCQAFTALLTDVNLLYNMISGSTAVDTYKVMNTGLDAVPDYLSNKVTVSTAISKTTTSPGGNEKMHLALNFTPQLNVFNATYFSATDITVPGSVSQTVSVDLNISAIVSAVSSSLTIPTINCASVGGVFTSAVVGTQPLYLYGSSLSTCQQFEPCGIRNWLFDSYPTGTYNVVVNTSASGTCSKVTLVPVTNTVAGCYSGSWVDYSAGILIASSTGATWAVTGFGSNVLPGSLGISQANPSYKWTTGGDLSLKGSLILDLSSVAVTTPPDGRSGTCTTRLFTLSTSCFPVGLTGSQSIDIGVTNIYDTPGAFSAGITKSYVTLNYTTGVVSLYTEYNYNSASVTSFQIPVTFDGIRFNLE